MMTDLKSYVWFSLNKIKDLGLHGVTIEPPKGYLRGLDVLGSDFQPALRRSCDVYQRHHGRRPNLFHPSSFTEKQLLFKFFAPIPIISTSDKLGARRYAEPSIGANIRIPKVVWSSKAASVPDTGELPDGRYWFKSNHSSGTNMPVSFPLSTEQREVMSARAASWFNKVHSRRLALWWYEIFQRQVFLEEDLSDADGFSADDWKFFVCNGRVVIFQHDRDRHRNHVQTIFDRNGNHLSQELYYHGGTPPDLPPEIGEMISFAESVGSNFDFMRVDLFLLNGVVYLGEIGLVPNGCSIPIRSPELDYMLGATWNAPWLGDGIEDWTELYTNSLSRHLFEQLPEDERPSTDFRPPWLV